MNKNPTYVKLWPSECEALCHMRNRCTLDIPTSPNFSIDLIPLYMERALNVQEEDKCTTCFKVLSVFADADESKETGLSIITYCCQLSLEKAYKALDMLIESELLYALMFDYACARESLLDWICQLDWSCQAKFWKFVKRMWKDDGENCKNIADILDVRNWTHVQQMLPSMQPHFADDVIFNEFVALLCWEIGKLSKDTGLFLMKNWAGDLAEELLRWLLLADSDEKWNIFAEGHQALPITWNGMPTGYGPDIPRPRRKQALSLVFQTRIITYNSNDMDTEAESHGQKNAWSIQQIRQWLIVCYQQPNYRDSHFFKTWLRDVESSGHLLNWRDGCQHVLLELLAFVFTCKIEHDKFNTDGAAAPAAKRVKIEA